MMHGRRRNAQPRLQTRIIIIPDTLVICPKILSFQAKRGPWFRNHRHSTARWQDLENRLAEIYLRCAEKVVFVRGDASVDFQNVADVIDLAHHAGVQRVGLLTMNRAVAGE